MKILKFEADWCAPCHALTKVMEDMDYEAVDIETDEGKAMAIEYRVGSVPTLVMVDDEGYTVKTMIGLKPRSAIERWVNG